MIEKERVGETGKWENSYAPLEEDSFKNIECVILFGRLKNPLLV